MKSEKPLFGSFVSGLTLLAACVALAGCASNALPLPTITSINPSTITAGDPGFTLKVMGTGFLSTDVVEWNGQVLPTQPISGTELDAQVPGTLIQSAIKPKAAFHPTSLRHPRALVSPDQTTGDVTVDITVLQKPPGSVVSNTATFTITPSNPTPALTITKTHSGNFTQGQTGATFTITVSNAGNGPTDGTTVTATEVPPSSLTVTALSGSGWSCVVTSLSCTRSDALAAGSSYPTITVTASVATNAPATIMNNVAVSGGGSTGGTGMDTVTVNPPPTPALKITKVHTGNFTQGQTGATFTVSVSNTGTGPTNGTVTAMDTPPTGLTITGISGTGWTCTVTNATCTRSDALAAGSSYSTITVTVSVATNAPSSVTNNVSVSGGGSTGGTGGDMVTVTPPPTPTLKITKTHTGNFTQGQTGATFTVTVSNTGTGASSGTVTVQDTPPTGLAITGISGTGWACNATTVTCTRSDALAASSSYPTIVVVANVATNAPASVTNAVSVSGGGSIPGTGSDNVTVNPATPSPTLAITKTHAGNFNQGGTGAYTITVSNTGTGPTPIGGTVSVADTIPSGLTPLTLAGTGWTCSIGVTVGCSRSDSLAAGSSYPAITLTVSVSTAAPATVTNNVTVTSGSLSASADDLTVINPAGGPAFTVTGFGPNSETLNNNVTVYFVVKNTGTGPTSGTVTVQVSSPSSLFLPIFIFGDPWNCDSGTLACTRSDVLAPGQSYPAIGITYQVGTGAPSPFTVSATASGGGAASNASFNVATPIVNCSPSSGLLCGQFALFTQGNTSAGPRAVAASFTADGAGHITAGTVDVNSMGAPQTGLAVLTGAPTGYSFESNGFGDIVLNTSAGAFTFKFIQNNLGNFADVIEFESSGTAGGSGFLLQQNPAFIANSLSGGYALGLLGGLGGASAGVRLGMVGAVNGNGACGLSPSGSTATINDGGAVSTVVNFAGTLNPAACTVDPTTGRGTAGFSSVTGSPAPPFSSANFVYYILGINITGQATSAVLLSTDQTSTTHPLLSGIVVLQANTPYNTNAAIDCGTGGPGLPTGCVFASSGATGGNVLSGNAHVSAGVATVTTQSNAAGAMNLLFDDNKAGVVNSGNLAATYSYAADGTGVITPASGEAVAFVLTSTDSGIILGTGGSVAFGTFVPQTATAIATPTAANFIASTQFEGTQAVTNTLVNSSFTPNSPGSNNGTISGHTRSWNSATLQTSNALAGNYSTSAIPATGRGTGTTTSGMGIDGAASFVYYVINANSFVLVGTTTTGAGTTTPVLMSFQAP